MAGDSYGDCAWPRSPVEATSRTVPETCQKLSAGLVGGRDRIRTCVGNAGDFTGRIGVTSRVPFQPHLASIIAHDVRNGPATASAVT
jgi:hypothetical protein